MDDAAFTRIDGKLFDRLHWGSLAPVTFLLKDGRKVTGQLLAVSRLGAAGECRGAATGEVWVNADGAKTSFSYEQIIDIE